MQACDVRIMTQVCDDSCGRDFLLSKSWKKQNLRYSLRNMTLKVHTVIYQ